MLLFYISDIAYYRKQFVHIQQQFIYSEFSLYDKMVRTPDSRSVLFGSKPTCCYFCVCVCVFFFFFSVFVLFIFLC